MSDTESVYVVTCTTEDFGGMTTEISRNLVAVYTSEDKAIAYCSLENIAEREYQRRRREEGNPAMSRSTWTYERLALIRGESFAALEAEDA